MAEPAMSQDELLAFARRHRFAAVASASSSGEPQVAIVRFVATDAFEVVFDTTDTTRKVVNLRRNPRIAVAIGWDENQTIQLEGLADEPEGLDLQRLKDTYANIYPDYFRTRQAASGLIYFRVRPTLVRYSDFRQNPATIITLNLQTGEETRAAVPFRGDAPY
jgi:general stress protein 26